jgi:hypothetical protein
LQINQLTRDRISVEQLSEWIGIGKGIADLIIQYAEEDVALAKAGRLSLAPNTLVGSSAEGDEWAGSIFYQLVFTLITTCGRVQMSVVHAVKRE